MPAGEDERLDRLYAEFYSDLDNRMMSSQRPLSEGADSLASIEEGTDLDQMPQIGTFNTVGALDGKLVRLPGYIVPLDFSDTKKLSHFLFVPYFGACIHTPPPPPNQIVFVEGTWFFDGDDLYRPYWIEGILTTTAAMNDIGNAAYSMKLSRLDPYDS